MRLAASVPSIESINFFTTISKAIIKYLAASAKKILNNISVYRKTIVLKLIKVRIRSILQRILIIILSLFSVQGLQ